MNENLESLTDSIKDLDLNIKNMKNIQSLSRDEEYILTKNYKEKNDISAVKRIIESNLSYITFIAKGYVNCINYSVSLKDLVNEGVVGLIKAIRNFDPEKKIRLISFAVFWIKSEIQEYVLKNSSIVKIANTKSQKKILFNLRKIKKASWLDNKEINTISRLFNVKKKDICYIESRLNKNDISLDLNENYDDEKEKKYIKNVFSNNNPLLILELNNWTEHVFNSIKLSLDKLNDRDKEIFFKRWFKKKKSTLKDLACKHGISAERIRQLEGSIIEKIKDMVFAEK